MTNRRKSAARCPRCCMQLAHCICEHADSVHSPHRLILVVHADEWKKPTNTGRWAALALGGAEVIVRGLPAREERLAPLLRDSPRRALLLYPSEASTLLTPSADAVDLIVPDGNWRQAAKVAKREPALRDVPCVHLLPDERSELRLRREHMQHGMATLEAIARAYTALGDPAAGAALHSLYELGAARVLATRAGLQNERLQ